MFRSSTILRDSVLSPVKVTFVLKQSVKLRCCILFGDVAACREMACVHSIHAILIKGGKTKKED